MRKRLIACIALVIVAGFVLASCSTQARAERKGKQAADQICKAKNSDNADEAARHIDRANDKLDDLARFTGRPVRDDLRDLDRNLDQIARGGASNQDVNAIVRNINEVKGEVSGNAEAAYDGLLQGLADCD
jgi:hypothetical protein